MDRNEKGGLLEGVAIWSRLNSPVRGAVEVKMGAPVFDPCRNDPEKAVS